MLLRRTQTNAGYSCSTRPQLCHHKFSHISAGCHQTLKMPQHISPRTASRVGHHLLVCKDRLAAGDSTSSAGSADNCGLSSHTAMKGSEQLPAATADQRLPALDSNKPRPAITDASSAPSVLLEPMAIEGLTPPAAIFDADAWNPDFNKSGLNGLKIGQTIGLTTVGGRLMHLRLHIHYRRAAEHTSSGYACASAEGTDHMALEPHGS